MKLLEINNLKTYFHTRSGTVRAVDDVSFSIEKGEIVGVVGESGSGKSVTCHSILGLLPQPPARIEGGTYSRQQENLLKLPKMLYGLFVAKRFQWFSGSHELPESVYDHS